MKNYSHIPSKSWWLPCLEVRDSPIDGKGVFTKEAIRKDTVVIKWGGIVLTHDEFYGGKGLAHTNVGIDEGIFLAEPADKEMTVDDYMNHSCDPNLWLIDEVTLVAKRDIEAGEELTIDYAIELSDISYAMKKPCNCGTARCRKQVTGLDWQLPIVQETNRGHFSPFIQRRIEKFLQGDNTIPTSIENDEKDGKERKQMKVLITGGSRGIGKAIATELAREGHELLLVSRTETTLAKTATEIQNLSNERILFYVCDVGNDDHLYALHKFCVHKGFVPDVLVLNAGIFIEGNLVDSPERDFDETLRVDFISIYKIVKMFYEDLKKKKYPKIILIGSTAAYEPYPIGPLYGVAKWALRGYAVNLRRSLMKDNIAVTFFAPGGTLTDLWEGADLPPNRLLEPKDIGIMIAAMLKLSNQAVVEEIIIRPMLGDIHE